MSSPTATPRPTLFISYASEDRVAVKQIRDALESAGLDVWFDENELGGGDAWDQKIRRQIRDCDFFMPVVSATTERRKEGYFRREWRLAVERNLDMADDVTFLLPVVIDGTSETAARVPERFFTVQWLRLPGGVPTAALSALAQRLTVGEVPPSLSVSSVPFHPPRVQRSALHSVPPLPPSAPVPAHDGPPPMPAFPHYDEKSGVGHLFKFFAEVIWWVITAAWLLLKRAPRWFRVIFVIWVIFMGFARCNRDEPAVTHTPRERPAEKSTAQDKAEVRATMDATAKELKKLSADSDQPAIVNKLALFGEGLARNLATQLKDGTNSGKQLVAVPFALGLTSEADTKLLNEIFVPLYGRLAVALPDETGLINTALPAVNEESLVALGKQLASDYVLGAQLLTLNGPTLRVKLMRIEDATVAWTADYVLEGRNPSDLANEIGTAVLAAARAPAHP